MITATSSFSVLNIASLVCAAGAVALAYRRVTYSLIAANFAVILAWLAGDVTLGTFIFWLIASAVAGVIVYMLPDEVKRSLAGVAYITTGALAGMAVGVAMGTMASLIIGSAAGALFGSLIYGNTAAGHELGFPSGRYFNYVMAKAFPALVAMCMAGIVFAMAIAKI